MNALSSIFLALLTTRVTFQNGLFRPRQMGKKSYNERMDNFICKRATHKLMTRALWTRISALTRIKFTLGTYHNYIVSR